MVDAAAGCPRGLSVSVCPGTYFFPVFRARAVVDGPQDAVADVAQLSRLCLGQRIEDKASHCLHVSWCGFDDLGPARLGEDAQGIAAVGGVGCAAHPATLLQPANHLGQARQRSVGEHRQLIIRMVRSGASDSPAMTTYSKWLIPRHAAACASNADGSLINTPASASQVCISSPVARAAGVPPWRPV